MTDPELMAHLAELGAQEEARKQAEASPTTLADIRKAGEELAALDKASADLEIQMKAISKRAQEIRINTLPKLMLMAGMNNFELTDGTIIEINDIINGKITDETREAAHQWLREQGHEDIIKNEIVVTFGKGEDKFAEHLMEVIDNMREDNELRCGGVDQKERVHPQTLGAFLRSMVDSGTPFPTDIFNLEVLKLAKLKKAKEKRA